jgi:hypothetical protein
MDMRNMAVVVEEVTLRVKHGILVLGHLLYLVVVEVVLVRV